MNTAMGMSYQWTYDPHLQAHTDDLCTESLSTGLMTYNVVLG